MPQFDFVVIYFGEYRNPGQLQVGLAHGTDADWQEAASLSDGVVKVRADNYDDAIKEALDIASEFGSVQCIGLWTGDHTFTKSYHNPQAISQEEIQALETGLYRIWWLDGGSSLAAVGIRSCGTKWFAPTNWVSGDSSDWSSVERVTKLA